jgi:hypothetical protein
MATATETDLDRRVGVLRRFRELLVEQRSKFERYLTVLDHERGDIESGDVDRLVAHVELEEQIVSEIFTFQKVIDPLEDLYRSSFRGSEDSDLPSIKLALSELKDEVARRSSENRGLLNVRMEAIRSEIASLRKPFASRPSVYAESGSGALVDLRG